MEVPMALVAEPREKTITVFEDSLQIEHPTESRALVHSAAQWAQAMLAGEVEVEATPFLALLASPHRRTVLRHVLDELDRRAVNVPDILA
jgi:hypothetical protein